METPSRKYVLYINICLLPLRSKEKEENRIYLEVSCFGGKPNENGHPPPNPRTFLRHPRPIRRLKTSRVPHPMGYGYVRPRYPPSLPGFLPSVPFRSCERTAERTRARERGTVLRTDW